MRATFGQRVKNAVRALRGGEKYAEIVTWLESNQGRGKYFKELRTVKDAISRNPYVRRAYEIYISTISSLPLQLVDKDGEELEDTLFHKVLMTPNKFQTWPQFIADTVKWLVSTGRYAIPYIPDGSGKPVMLYHLDASKLSPRVSKDPLNPIAGFTYGGAQIPAENIIYDYWSTPNTGYAGESPIESALEQVATTVAIARVIRNLAENNQRPGVILSPKERLGDKELKALQKDFDRGSAADRAGKSMILPLDVSLLQAIISPHEAQLNETNEAIINGISVGTGIPRILLEPGGATFENQKEVYKILYKLTIIPMLVKIQTAYTDGIARKFNPTWRLQFDLSGVWALKPDYKEMSDAIPNLLKVLSYDETRMLLPGNLEPLLEGGENVMGAAMEEAKGIAPPVKSKQTKSKRERESQEVGMSNTWDKVRAALRVMTPEEERPYPNEHACRLKDPKQYDSFRRKKRKAENGKEYSIIFGIKGTGANKKSEEQAYRYDKDVWSASEAGSHCKKHDGKFEPAAPKKKSIKFLDSPLEPQRQPAGGFTATQRELYWRTKKIELTQYRRLFEKALAKLYRQQAKRVNEYLEDFDDNLSGLPDVEDWFTWKDEEKKFRDMAHPKLLGIFADAASRIHDGFKATAAHKNRIGEYSDKFAELVNATTVKQLTEALDSAKTGRSLRQDGDDEEPEEKLPPKAALLIGVLAVYKRAEGMRAKAGAWRETHNAQGYGIVEGIKEEGGEKKQWVCAFNNSRPEHEEADGQKVGIDEPFVVMGEAVMWPGEGSIENSANCQCTIMVAKE